MAASFDVSVTGNMKKVLRDMERLHGRVVYPASASALNKVAKRIRTRALRRIASVGQLGEENRAGAKYGNISLTQKVVGRRLSRLRGRARATKHKQSVQLYLKHRPINAAPVAMGAGGFVGMKKEKGKKKSAGLKVKGRNIPGVWAFGPGWTTKKGRTFPKGIILKRQGGERYPTTAIKVHLWPQAGEIIRGLMRRMGAIAWKKEMERELKYRLNKKAA